MDLNDIQSFKLLQEKMKYHSSRQEVIAENFANVDTPRYYRKDVKQPDFASMVGMQSSTIGLRTTDPNHIDPNSPNSPSNILSTDVRVKLDMEALQMTQNSGEFSKATSTYRKMLMLVREAIGGGQ